MPSSIPARSHVSASIASSAAASVCTPSAPEAGAVLEARAEHEPEELRRHLVVLLVRLLDLLGDRRGRAAARRTPPSPRAAPALAAQPGRAGGADAGAQQRVGHAARRDQPVDERFGAHGTKTDVRCLVAAVGVAARAQRRLLRRRHAGDEEDEVEDERRCEEGEPAPRRGDGDERVGDPGQRLEEVVRVARVAPEAAVASRRPVRRVALNAASWRSAVALERGGDDPEREARPLHGGEGAVRG